MHGHLVLSIKMQGYETTAYVTVIMTTYKWLSLFRFYDSLHIDLVYVFQSFEMFIKSSKGTAFHGQYNLTQ